MTDSHPSVPGDRFDDLFPGMALSAVFLAVLVEDGDYVIARNAELLRVVHDDLDVALIVLHDLIVFEPEGDGADALSLGHWIAVGVNVSEMRDAGFNGWFVQYSHRIYCLQNCFVVKA